MRFCMSCVPAVNGECCPKDFPIWSIFYEVFWKWRNGGVWQRIHDRLREKVRKAAGKKSTPTAAIIDSQSIRTAEGGEERGHDAGKEITGRKRHIAVDTLGLLLTVVVHGADWQDQNAAEWVMENFGEQYRRLKVVFGDSARVAQDCLIGFRRLLDGYFKPCYGQSA